MLMLSIRSSLTWFVLDLNVTPFVVLRGFSGIPIHLSLDIEGMTHGEAVHLVGPRAPEVGPTCAVSTSEYAGGCVGRMTHVFSPSGCTTISRPDSFSSTDLTRYGSVCFLRFTSSTPLRCRVAHAILHPVRRTLSMYRPENQMRRLGYFCLRLFI